MQPNKVLEHFETQVTGENYATLPPKEALENSAASIENLITAMCIRPRSMQELTRMQRVIMFHASQSPIAPEQLELIARRFKLEEQILFGTYKTTALDELLLNHDGFREAMYEAQWLARNLRATGRNPFPSEPPAMH
ncbi:MAG: hypothetical protein ABJH63_10615 [Rhizobiaceae bacterium]